MSQVLVTGAAGTLGTALVAKLADQGHTVRALVRHRSADFPPTVQVTRGDVRNPAELRAAVTGVDTVIHAATSPFRQTTVTEIEGTRAVLAAADSAGLHVIYPSIVGADRLSGTYYRAKWQAEQLVAAARNTTIQRATQLHPTLNKMLSHHAFPVTAHLAFQPLDAGDLAECLAGLVEAGPAGRAEDIGGPEVLALRDLVTARRAATSQRTLLIPVPALGPLRSLDAGHHLTPGNARGQITWHQWLSRTSAASRQASALLRAARPIPDGPPGAPVDDSGRLRLDSASPLAPTMPRPPRHGPGGAGESPRTRPDLSLLQERERWRPATTSKMPLKNLCVS